MSLPNVFTTVSSNQKTLTENKPRHEKTCLRGFRPGKTQTAKNAFVQNAQTWELMTC